MKGLTDPMVGLLMGQTAENLAHRFGITREQQDDFSVRSHRRVMQAQDEGQLAPGGVPRWDYDARRGAPVDVSAGMITSAGMFHLVSACRALPGVCGSTRPWSRLGRRLLAASLARASARPPLGLLPDQVLNEHGRGCWCNGGELIFGLSYGLEALGLERGAR